MNNILFPAASALFSHAFPLYKQIYFQYKNYHDRHAITRIRQIIKPGFTVLDIGSNIGFYAMLFSELTRLTGKVYCFEPDSDNFKKLCRVTKNKENILLNNLAVAEETKKLHLYRSHRINVDHRTYPVQRFETSYQINAVSVDAFVNGAFKVDFIKLDIQGAEYEAIKGMTTCLEENKNIVVIMELWPKTLEYRGIPIDEIIMLIKDLGFSIFLIKGGKLVPWNDPITRHFAGYGKDESDDIIFFRKGALNFSSFFV